MRTVAPPSGAQQKDNLCGPFWTARILAEAGFATLSGAPIDEDLVALRAGTTLPPATAEPSVPHGATSRTSYRYELPVAPAWESGTSPDGLARVIEEASEGKLRCVPVRGRWDEATVERLIGEAPQLGARLLANLRTGRLWGSHPPAGAILEELAGHPTEGPAADWDVGHFVELAMLVRGSGGALVVVHDSYPGLGWQGRHVQPPRVVAAALLRGDGREGGVLAVVPQENAEAMSTLVSEIGLEVGTWNNGSRSDGNGDR